MDHLKTLRTKSLKTWLLPGALGLLLFVIAACGGGAAATPDSTAQTNAACTSGTTTAVVETTQSNPQVFPDDTEADRLVAAQETVMNRIFTKALPSVVNIQVIQGREGNDGTGQFPNIPGGPDDFLERGEGSGFVWDAKGRIVTNQHVVDGAPWYFSGVDGDIQERVVLKLGNHVQAAPTFAALELVARVGQSLQLVQHESRDDQRRGDEPGLPEPFDPAVDQG